MKQIQRIIFQTQCYKNPSSFYYICDVRALDESINIKSYKMEELLSRQKTIAEIVKKVEKLDDLELQILLTRLCVKKMQKEGVKSVANPPKNIRMPTMEEVNLWKHEARKKYAHK